MFLNEQEILIFNGVCSNDNPVFVLTLKAFFTHFFINHRKHRIAILGVDKQFVPTKMNADSFLDAIIKLGGAILKSDKFLFFQIITLIKGNGLNLNFLDFLFFLKYFLFFLKGFRFNYLRRGSRGNVFFFYNKLFLFFL